MTPLYISICRAPLHMANLCINSTEFAKVSELAKTCKNLTSIMHIMSLSSPLSLFLTENTFLLLDTMYPLNLSIHIYSNHIYSIHCVFITKYGYICHEIAISEQLWENATGLNLSDTF